MASIFWAFLSVELALLMIFMVVPSDHPHHPLGVDLSPVDHPMPMPGAIREDAMIISVARDGNIFLGAQQVRLSQLPPRLLEALRQGSERKIYLKVDARAKFSDAAGVIDQIRLAGIQDVGIITEQRSPSVHR
jgi:biopolymer transport protein ExbD/biopolymer transport protein TolR